LANSAQSASVNGINFAKESMGKDNKAPNTTNPNVFAFNNRILHSIFVKERIVSQNKKQKILSYN